MRTLRSVDSVRVALTAALGLSSFGCGGTAAMPSPDGSADANPSANEAGDCKRILASSYDQSCVVDSDCVPVSVGDPCATNCPLVCIGDAINAHARSQYLADVSKSQGSPPQTTSCACGNPGVPCCQSGRCGLAGICSGPGTDAGQHTQDGGAEASADAAGDASGHPCAKDTDCSGMACAFSIAAGCAATGVCMPVTAGGACADLPACTCAGTTDHKYRCGLDSTNGLYAHEPIAYEGACTDGGAFDAATVG